MKVLVIGGGGREHALCWKLRQSPRITKLYCAPGNGGIAQDAEIVPADVKDVAGLASLAQKLSIDLTIVGPELPLTLGIELRETPDQPESGIVDEYLDLFTRGFEVRHQLGGGIRLRKIDGDYARIAEFLRQGLEPVLPPRREHEAMAALRQLPREFDSEPGGRAGD